MIFAANDLNAWQQALIVGLVIAFTAMFGLLVWAILKGMRSFNARAERALDEIYQSFNPSSVPTDESVQFVFHTYHGVFAWVIQTEHRLILPDDQAEQFLNRLHRFNLRWGLLSYGALYVPFLTYGNLWSQRRAIRKQLRAKAK